MTNDIIEILTVLNVWRPFKTLIGKNVYILMLCGHSSA